MALDLGYHPPALTQVAYQNAEFDVIAHEHLMDEPSSPTAVFSYKLVSDYATRHADGSLARQAPLGGIILTFYVERFGYPTLMEQKFKEDGSLGEIVKFETEGHVFREIQSGVVLSRATAAALRDRLNDLLNEPTA